MRAFASQHGFRLSTELADAIADPQVQAVFLATPHSLHVEQVEAVTAAGKPVWCEKPLALTRADAARAVDACREAGVPLGSGNNKRCFASMRELKRVVDSGVLGDILHIEGHFSNEHSTRVVGGGWRDDPRESPGGGLTGAGLHVLDALINLGGPIRSVDAKLFEQKAAARSARRARGAGGVRLGRDRHDGDGARGAERLADPRVRLQGHGRGARRGHADVGMIGETAADPDLRARRLAESAGGGLRRRGRGRAPFPVSPDQMLDLIGAFEAILTSLETRALRRKSRASQITITNERRIERQAVTGMDEVRDRFQNLHEIVAAARAKLDRNIWDYLIGGAETETTVRRNRLAHRLAGLPPARSAQRQSTPTPAQVPQAQASRCRWRWRRSAASSVSIRPRRSPVANAAGTFGIPMFQSSVSKPELEETAKEVPEGLKIFQLYVRGDQAWVEAIFDRAVAAGFGALCLTVDTHHYSRRERDISKRYPAASARTPEHARHQKVARLGAIRQAPGELQAAADRQGHRHRRGRQARGRARRRRDLRVQPRRAAARPRPRHHRRAAGDRGGDARAAPRSSSTAASAAAPT